MRLSPKSVGLVCAALLGLTTTTIPAAAATCDVRKVITDWTSRKTALRDIRIALKKLTAAMAGDTPGNVVDYGPDQFGGPGAKQGFVGAVTNRQAEFSIVILQFAGNCVLNPGTPNPVCTPNTPPTTCYVCPIQGTYALAQTAKNNCKVLMEKVQARPGFQGLTFNCDKLAEEGPSRIDLGKFQAFGYEYWNQVIRFQGPGLGSLSDALNQPQTSDGDAVVRFAIGGLEGQLKAFQDNHVRDPNPTQLATDVTTTQCPGYADYVAGKESW